MRMIVPSFGAGFKNEVWPSAGKSAMMCTWTRRLAAWIKAARRRFYVRKGVNYEYRTT